MPDAFNLCKELRCPHADRNGCNRFTVSNHCPVAYLGKGNPHPEIHANQYWLFADRAAQLDINELRSRLQEVLETESPT